MFTYLIFNINIIFYLSVFIHTNTQTQLDFEMSGTFWSFNIKGNTFDGLCFFTHSLYITLIALE